MTASSDFCPGCVGISVIPSGDLGFVGPTSETPAQIYCIRVSHFLFGSGTETLTLIFLFSLGSLTPTLPVAVYLQNLPFTTTRTLSRSALPGLRLARLIGLSGKQRPITTARMILSPVILLYCM